MLLTACSSSGWQYAANHWPQAEQARRANAMTPRTYCHNFYGGGGTEPEQICHTEYTSY